MVWRCCPQPTVPQLWVSLLFYNIFYKKWLMVLVLTTYLNLIIESIIIMCLKNNNMKNKFDVYYIALPDIISTLPKNLSDLRDGVTREWIPNAQPEPSRSLDVHARSGVHKYTTCVPDILYIFAFHLSGEQITGPGLQIGLIGKQGTSQ